MIFNCVIINLYVITPSRFMILYESQTHVLWLEFSCPPSIAPRSLPPHHPTNILRFRWAPCHLIFQHRPLLDTLCGVFPAQKPLTLYWEQPSDSPVAFSSHSVGDPLEKLAVWKGGCCLNLGQSDLLCWEPGVAWRGSCVPLCRTRSKGSLFAMK